MICGSTEIELVGDFASTDGTTNIIVPNINEKIIDFFIIPPLNIFFTGFVIEVPHILRRLLLGRRLTLSLQRYVNVAFPYSQKPCLVQVSNHRAERAVNVLI